MIIRYEDSLWINGVGIYFSILKDINETLLYLVSLDEQSINVELVEQIFFKLCVETSRLIPTYKDKNSKQFVLSKKDGILKLKKYIKFLKKEYNKLFELNKIVLEEMHNIRNKYEHEPHNIQWTTFVGGNNNKKMIFTNKKYDPMVISQLEETEKKKLKLKWEIETKSIIKLILMTNEIFNKIKEKFLNYFANDSMALAYPYFNSINNIRFDFYNDKLKCFL